MTPRPPEDGPDPIDDIVVECELTHPQEKVWRAFTEPDLLARWLEPRDFSARPGQSFTVPLGRQAAANDDAAACEVLEIAPPHRMRIAWRLHGAGGATGPVDSVVSLELTALEGHRTWLRIVHSGMATRASAERICLRPSGKPATPRTEMRLAA